MPRKIYAAQTGYLVLGRLSFLLVLGLIGLIGDGLRTLSWFRLLAENFLTQLGIRSMEPLSGQTCPR
jgi:hypothetical protein